MTSWKHGGMACMAGVPRWMAASSSEGTGEEGEEALDIRELLDCRVEDSGNKVWNTCHMRSG